MSDEQSPEVAQLKAAIDADDLAAVVALMTAQPELHRAPLGYNDNGPLTWAAECRRAPPSPARLEIVRWMLEHGSDVHQGGDGPLMRAALSDQRIGMMALLVEHGADVNARWNGSYPIIFAPCETLQPKALQWLIDHGADPQVTSNRYGGCVSMLVGTYSRNPAGKHACLEVFADLGVTFPDTAPVAVHRGRVDLLAACIERQPELLSRRFEITEFFPPKLSDVGLHCAPLAGGTLLHLATEYHEAEIARWLIEHGADASVPAAIDAEGFGGHTPLFHATVTLAIKTDTLARVLLAGGADPNARATFRKALSWEGDPEKERMHEYHDVTAISFARQFQEPGWVNEAAIGAIREFGGA